MSTLAIVIFVAVAIFISWFVPGITSAILQQSFDTYRELQRARRFSAF
jgi:hypothetical protein